MEEADITVTHSLQKPCRCAYYDNIKFVLIILVVIAHAFSIDFGISSYAPALFIFINMFHMPAFIFISGLFHKNEQVDRRMMLLASYLLLYKIIEMDFISPNIISGQTV
mgnify:CR=1 FL=1